MISALFLKLTENDKRVIFVLLALLIIVLVLIAFIGYLVTKVMKWQGKKINNYVTDPVVTGVITNEKDFRRYAKKKNLLVFYRQARIPAIIVILSLTFYFVTGAILGYKNPFSHIDGFGTLLWVWDFSKIISTPDSGAGILINWPTLINTPHINLEAWPSYVFIPTIFIGGLWYLFTVQGFIARYLQINKLGQKIFGERIENFVAGQNEEIPPKEEK